MSSSDQTSGCPYESHDDQTQRSRLSKDHARPQVAHGPVEARRDASGGVVCVVNAPEIRATTGSDEQASVLRPEERMFLDFLITEVFEQWQ